MELGLVPGPGNKESRDEDREPVTRASLRPSWSVPVVQEVLLINSNSDCFRSINFYLK